MMMKWTLGQEEEEVFFVRDGKKEGTVDRLGMGEAFYMLQVFLADGQLVEVSMKDFEVGSNSFSVKFKEDVKSRTKFYRKWQEIVCMNKSDDANSTDSSQLDLFSSPPEVIGNDVSSVLCADDVTKADDKSSTAGMSLDIIKKKLIGTFQVHLDNLVSPSVEHRVRAVSYSHVTELERSFASNNLGQMTTLVGMARRNHVTEEEFKEPGSVMVEVLGGQHTVLALKSLHARKVVPAYTRVTVYAPLETSLALKVGVHHNIINETSRQMTFIELVRLIRERQPSSSMTKADTREWKNDLMIIFGDKTIELLEGRMQNHIALSRVGDEVWSLILQAGEAYGDVIQQTFFKDLVSFSETVQLVGMKCLVENGPKSFKSKMKEYRKQYPKRKRQRKTDSPMEFVQEQEKESEEPNNSAEAYLKEIKDLKEEVESLREKLQKKEETPESEPESKKSRLTNDEEISVGDRVMAHWANDGNMYEALVLNIETVYSVQYVLDKKKKKLIRNEIQTTV